MGIAQVVGMGANPSAATISVSGSVIGTSPENVASASGLGSAHMSVSVSGGTAPYSYSWVRLNGAGKVNLAADTVERSNKYCVYSGLNVGEIDSCFARCDVTDSVGNFGSSGGLNIAIRRTS